MIATGNDILVCPQLRLYIYRLKRILAKKEGEKNLCHFISNLSLGLFLIVALHSLFTGLRLAGCCFTMPGPHVIKEQKRPAFVLMG